MSAPALRLAGVTKSYRRGRPPALRGIDLEVATGELLGLLGPNGAGKSTCLRVLVGLTRRDGGVAEVLGLDPTRRGVAIRRRCAYLPGEATVDYNLRGRDVLRFALASYPRRQDALAAELERAFALPLQRKVREFSAGMKQKLLLLATLAPDVDVYLLDEPERALDPSARLFLRDVLRRLAAAGKTIVLSSHHLGEVEALASRLVFLAAGRTVAPARVAAARDALRREVRLRLRVDGADLPAGARDVRRDPDGALRLRVDGDPVRWLGGLAPEVIESVEIGATRLEELYRALDASEAGP